MVKTGTCNWRWDMSAVRFINTSKSKQDVIWNLFLHSSLNYCCRAVVADVLYVHSFCCCCYSSSSCSFLLLLLLFFFFFFFFFFIYLSCLFILLLFRLLLLLLLCVSFLFSSCSFLFFVPLILLLFLLLLPLLLVHSSSFSPASFLLVISLMVTTLLPELTALLVGGGRIEKGDRTVKTKSAAIIHVTTGHSSLLKYVMRFSK